MTKITNKKTRITFTFATLITFIALASMSFAQECPVTNCIDGDGDKYAKEGTTCNTNQNCLVCKCGDCDDGDPTFNPGAEEKCASVNDENCNGLISCYDPYCCDAKHGECIYSESPLWTDSDGDKYTICENDCDDGDPTFNPGAEEKCQSLNDENCNDLISCEDPVCAGDPGPGNNQCCQDASDCTQKDCETETCENNICTYTQIFHETNCYNGIDDDCDGATDCEDNDCENYPCNEIPEYPPGYIIPILLTLLATYKLKGQHISI